MGPPGEGAVTPLQEDYIKGIERITGVDLAIGRIIENARLEFNGRSDFTFAGSMPKGSRQRKEVIRIAQLDIDQGTLPREKDVNKVVLGHNYLLAERMGKPVRLRDTVTINDHEFEVTGFLEKKGSFIVDNLIVMNEDEMKDLYTVNDTYDIIAVVVSEGNDMAIIKTRIENYLREERDVDKGEEDFSVESPEQGLESLDSTLFAVQIFIYVIAGISIIIGGIGIANTMYTSVVERTKQIGIMKSIGARQSNIFTLFLIEAGFLGGVGGLIGALFGSALAYGLAFVGRNALHTELIVAHVSFSLVMGALLFSFIIGSAAGFLPAYQASTLKPVDALRRAT